jgi:hypothetical protein
VGVRSQLCGLSPSVPAGHHRNLGNPAKACPFTEGLIGAEQVKPIKLSSQYMNFFAIIRLRKDTAWLTGKVLITLSPRKQGFLIDLPVEIRPVQNLFALAALAFSACDDARHTSPASHFWAAGP